MRKIKPIIVGVALAAVLLLCNHQTIDSESGLDVEDATSLSVLRIGFMQQIDSMNPFVGLNDASRFFYGLVYDALTSVGNNLEAVPNLAVSNWIVPTGYDSDPKLIGMPYGSVWQYNLTDSAYFTDGVRFTADDVIYNVWLNAEPSHYDSMWAYQPYSYYMHEAWKWGDDFTVRISYWDRVTFEPIPAAYAYLLSIPMLPKHLMEQLPGGFPYIGMNWTGLFSETLSPGMPVVGTGPFMATPNIFSEWIAGDYITLVRNPNCHWSSDYGKQIKFDQLVMKFFQDSTSMAFALNANQIDVAAYPPTMYDSIKDLVATGTFQNITTYDGPKISQYFTHVGFCMNDAGPNPSRLDPVIRQALHMATNKEYIVGNMYLGYGDAGTTLVPPVNSRWHYEPTAGELFGYDLTEAANLLEANGYIDIDSDGVRECTIGSTAVQMGWVAEGQKLRYDMIVRKEYPEEKDIALYLKSQWEEVGVIVQIQVVEELILSMVAYSYSYDMVIWYWSADIDPNYILFPQTKHAWAGWSDNKYFNPAYDENYTLSVYTLNMSEREVFVDNCQRTHYIDSPYIILAYLDQTYAWRTDTFTGWGDWAANRGRSLDNCWTGNPLFFDLEPILVIDDTPPIAVAVVTPNPANQYDLVTLNGSLSTDNSGSIVDYNWTLVYAGTDIEIHGAVVAMVFAIDGVYNITLTCSDESGNFNSSTVQLCVNPVIPELGVMPIGVVVLAMAVFIMAVARRTRAR